MNKNSIIKHFATIGSGTVVVLLINLITAPIITRLVAPDEYGIQSVFVMYATLAASFFYLGQDQALLRFFYTKEEEDYKRTLLYRCIKYPLLLCIVASIILFAIKKTDIFEIEYDNWILVCLCIYTTILVIDRFASLLLRLTYKTKSFSVVNVIYRLSYLLISVGMIYFMQNHYAQILIIATMLSAVLSMVLNVLFERNFWNLKKGCNNPECISTRDILKYGMPFIVSGGVASIFNVTDTMVVKAYGTYSDVGIYSSALGLVSAFAIIQTTFCTLWTPLTFENYEKNPEDRSLYIKGHNIITVVVFAAGLTMILGKDIFVFMLGEKYREASYLLPFLIFNPIMYTVSETTVSGLYFMKKSNMQIFPPLVACTVNLIGNIILVQILGYRGAAISTGLSYIVFFIMRTVLGRHYYYIDFELKSYYIVTLVVTIYAFYNTFFHFNMYTVAGYFICLSVLILLYRKTVKEMLFYIRDFIQSKIDR